MVSAWLDALAVLKTASGVREMVSALQPAHRRALEGTASFLERRAGLYLAVGEAALARQDYRAAIALQPGQASLRVAYWWMLVDQRETASLRSELARMAARVRKRCGLCRSAGRVLAAAGPTAAGTGGHAASGP
jgi:Flp pilus assembly protein TadD